MSNTKRIRNDERSTFLPQVVKPNGTKLYNNQQTATRQLHQQQQNYNSPPLEIYCRLRPSTKEIDYRSCLKIISQSTLKLVQPGGDFNCTDFQKENYFNFKKIFGDDSAQTEIYESVGLPMVKNLLHGQNSLVFAYGQSGSGKSYTMNGESGNYGLIPRCAYTIFKNISGKQSEHIVFRQDKFNNYHATRRTNTNHNNNNNDKGRIKKEQQGGGCGGGGSNKQHLSDLNVNNDDSLVTEQDFVYSLFINYIEIYNNSVYDLLDEKGINKWQNKPIREDSHHRVFVHGIKEIEVKTIENLLEIFRSAQKRRKLEHTTNNSDSNRSHTVFSLKLVRIRWGCGDRETSGTSSESGDKVVVSQLNLVDLAGGERTSRTKNTGQRLREAGNINNSLMTLRYCLEVLRENQVNGCQKIIPYRDSKVTHLFKNFFDGDGAVCLIICVIRDNYDDTFKILKFSSEIQLNRLPPFKFTPLPILGRRKSQQSDIINIKEIKNDLNSSEKDTNTMASAAATKTNGYNTKTEYVLNDLMKFLESRVRKKPIVLNQSIRDSNRNIIEQEYTTVKEENQNLIELLDLEQTKNRNLECDNATLNETVQHYTQKINELQNMLNCEKSKYSQLENDARYQEYQSAKLLDEEKLKNCKMEKKLRDCEIDLTEMKIRYNEMKEFSESIQEELNGNIEKLKSKLHRKDMLLTDLNKQLIEAKNLEKMSKRAKARKNGRYIRSADHLKFDRQLIPVEPSGVTGIFIKQKPPIKATKDMVAVKTDEIKRIRPKTIHGAIKRKGSTTAELY